MKSRQFSMPTYVVPPCYDRKNNIDCPNRSTTCHGTCAKWNEYVEQRDQKYKERKDEVITNEALNKMHETRMNRHSYINDRFRANARKKVIK